ncbi:MAG: OsmC family protein [Clostridium perfringens]|nr:OsmC family protein [Clostridium perfringens]
MNNIELNAIEELNQSIMDKPESGILHFTEHLSWQTGTANNISIRDFKPILVDEPCALGGRDLAPNPIEYLIAGAISCFSISFEILASKEGVKLESLDVDFDTDFDLAVFFGIKDGEKGIQHSTIKIKAKTDVSPEKLEELFNSAKNSSPVLNSLKTKPEIVIL